MADVVSLERRAQIMSLVRGKGNRSTELKAISLFREHRITGWRRSSMMDGKPDFVFRDARVVIFVDGCYWHGCRKHGRIPKSNKRYWLSKIAGNRARDKKVGRMLRRKGWFVLRIWEHDLRNSRTAAKIAQRLKDKLPHRPILKQSYVSRQALLRTTLRP